MRAIWGTTRNQVIACMSRITTRVAQPTAARLEQRDEARRQRQQGADPEHQPPGMAPPPRQRCEQGAADGRRQRHEEDEQPGDLGRPLAGLVDQVERDPEAGAR